MLDNHTTKDLFDLLNKRIQQDTFYMLSYFTTNEEAAITRNLELLLAEQYLRVAQKLLEGIK